MKDGEPTGHNGHAERGDIPRNQNQIYGSRDGLSVQGHDGGWSEGNLARPVTDLREVDR